MRVDWRALQTFGPDLPQRAGILAAAGSTGMTFQRGLLPRSTVQQAAITGGIAALSYGVTAFLQSSAEAVAYRLVREERSRYSPQARQGLLIAADVGAAALGLGLQRAMAQRPDEPLRRPLLRTVGDRLVVTGVAGSLVVGSVALMERLDPSGRLARSVPVSVPVGAAIAAYVFHRQRRAQAETATVDAEGRPVEADSATSVRKSVLIGTGITGGLVALAKGEQLVAGGVGSLLGRTGPTGAALARPAGHLVGLGVLVGAGYAAVRFADTKTEAAGVAVEAAYQQPPTSPHVSGGPNSTVPFDSIGREGRRFVNMALTASEIEQVMGESAQNPVRAFVGLGTAVTADQRADLAMAELERLGAFEKSLIVFCSPTGTGYVNYVTVETLEYLTRGDVATVAIQYSVRPSFLSLDRVSVGRAENAAFLHALRWRLEAVPQERRPRLAIFGESLGAQTGLGVFEGEGAAGFDRARLDRGLFLGTPHATRWHQQWLRDPGAMDPDGVVVEVSSYQEWLALPEEQRQRARVMLLTHHNDPIAKWGPVLAIQAPTWMGPAQTREPGVPTETHWRPFTTFLITFVDVMNAMNPVPGKFVASGHDYRADLARFTRLAYGLDCSAEQLAQVEHALREREVTWAQRRVVSEELQKAREGIQAQLQKWGVSLEAPLPETVVAPGVAPGVS